MQFDEFVTKIKTRLVLNDKLIKQLEEERKDVVFRQVEEQKKVEKHFLDVVHRLESARDGLLAEVDKEAMKMIKNMDLREQNLNSACLVLSPELITIQEVMMNKFKMDEFNVSGCWERVQSLLDDNIGEENDTVFPKFFNSSSNHSKLKKADFGFLQLAEFLPKDFFLALTSPIFSLHLGSQVTCSVVTPVQFTSLVQANIQFSIRLEGTKTSVPFSRDECKVSSDGKSFQIVFPAEDTGVYLVTVLLYGQHVQHSPLHVLIQDQLQHVQLYTDNCDIKNETNDYSCPEGGDEKINKTTYDRRQSRLPPRLDNKQVRAQTRISQGQQSPNNDKKIEGGVMSQNGGSNEKIATAPQSPPPSTIHSLRKLSRQFITKPPKASQVTKPNLVSHLKQHASATDFTLLLGSGCVMENVTMKIPASTERKCGKSTLTMPIGLCLLQNKNVVVASTFEDKVKMFSNTGKFIKLVVPGTTFNHPSDMITLQSGQFVVRDDTSIQFFNTEGNYIMSLDSGLINKCYGLAENEEGLLVTINENKGTAWRRKGEMKVTGEGETAVGETDLLFFCVETGKLVKRMELTDIIKDKQRSKCRFLTSWQGKLLITDLGLDCIYTLDPITRGVVKCGKTGTGPGCFSDPAGLVVDSKGNWLVADSRNHRLCVYTSKGGWVGEVRLRPGARRPSGLAMDKDTGEVYLLNLQGNWAVVRFALNGVGS